LREELRNKFFDTLLRTLNYAIEFADERSYASLRFMDLFQQLLDLQKLISELRDDKFYDELRNKLKERQIMVNRDERKKLQKELLKIFIEEWKKRKRRTSSFQNL